ncbi:something about silencing protein 10 [Coccinella septempunctata]|uniref:something about silencing protein 10 n=1 Tax=Coccinella septempunctata TaxID=41139 RepID=UPI001D067A87|nr:something about silencing protein 10 [Coccinella septempunctata]
MSDYSDSDSDYNENEKLLLNKYRQRQHESDEENEEAVFNVASDDGDDSDDYEDVLADSDIEGQEEDDDLPDEKAWGRNKKAFYSTDYVDPRSEKEKVLEFAELEEEAGKKLEGEIYDQLGIFTSDFSEQVENEEEEEDDETEKESQLVQAEEDISTNLIDDFEDYTGIYENFLKPIDAMIKSDKISNSSLIEFVQCFSDLILNYSTNISMYFLLKAENTLIKNHPILKRLQQYQEAIGKLQTVFEEYWKSKIEEYLNVKESPDKKTVKPKKLKILQNPVVEKPSKKRKFGDAPIEKIVEITKKMKMEEESTKEEVQEDGQVDELVKRPITYQMAKNKGLTPHRKKEQRNPRVKHRNKYKKAKIRRKGAVREVRNESSRYGGEMSGINAHVLKGIKLRV